MRARSQGSGLGGERALAQRAQEALALLGVAQMARAW